MIKNMSVLKNAYCSRINVFVLCSFPCVTTVFMKYKNIGLWKRQVCPVSSGKLGKLCRNNRVFPQLFIPAIQSWHFYQILLSFVKFVIFTHKFVREILLDLFIHYYVVKELIFQDKNKKINLKLKHNYARSVRSGSFVLLQKNTTSHKAWIEICNRKNKKILWLVYHSKFLNGHFLVFYV